MDTLTVHVVFSIFALVLGLLVGSFLNVCVHRLPLGLSVVKPRSRCPSCENPIVWYDNIPVVSWLLLGAKCRNCKTPISWQYPLVELLTGLLFFGVYWRFQWTMATPVYMALAAALVLVTFVDLTDWTIPNEVTYPGIPIGVVCAVILEAYPESGLHCEGALSPVFNSLIGVVVGGGSLYLLDKLSLLLLKKRGMGFGDVKLLAMLGAFFGYQSVILIIMLASVLGSVVGVALILLARAKTEVDGEAAAEGGHYLPFGPYLSVAGLVAMFAAPQIFAAYASYMDRLAGAPLGM